ncbi:MAG: hypothetical protein ACP5T6_03765, partial [Candidatus Micrarchaeia archaeon]
MKMCEQVYNHSVVLYSLPKSNSTLKNHGVRDWKRIIYELILNSQGFLKIFHHRSISETINLMMKGREPTSIRKRLLWRKSIEEYLKVNIHNLK